GDADFFRFVAPAADALTVSLDGADGASVQVFDGGGTQIASAYPPSAPLTGFHLAPGQTYFVVVFDYSGTPGPYHLTFRPAADDFGNDFGTAQEIVLSPTGEGAVAGTVDYPGDVDVFRFVAGSAAVRVRQTAAPGSGLDSSLSAFDADGSSLASDDEFG